MVHWTKAITLAAYSYLKVRVWYYPSSTNRRVCLAPVIQWSNDNLSLMFMSQNWDGHPVILNKTQRESSEILGSVIMRILVDKQTTTDLAALMFERSQHILEYKWVDKMNELIMVFVWHLFSCIGWSIVLESYGRQLLLWRCSNLWGQSQLYRGLWTRIEYYMWSPRDVKVGLFLRSLKMIGCGLLMGFEIPPLIRDSLRLSCETFIRSNR